MKIQSTDTFRGSLRHNYWDQSGQKWLPNSQNPAPEKPETQTVHTAGTEPETKNPKGKSEVSFKRQPQQDTFQGTTAVIARPRKAGDMAKTIGTAAFGFVCLAVGVLSKSKVF